MTTPIKDIYIHSLFNSLVNNFIYISLGLRMLTQKYFQDKWLKKMKLWDLECKVEFRGSKWIEFDEKEIFDSFEEKFKPIRSGGKTKTNLLELLNFIARLTAIYLVDILQNSKYNTRLLHRTNVFKFAKEVRNGAAHDNRFKLDRIKDLPIVWRDKTINKSLDGKEVFHSFLAPGDLIILIADLSEEIRNIEQCSLKKS